MSEAQLLVLGGVFGLVLFLAGWIARHVSGPAPAAPGGASREYAAIVSVEALTTAANMKLDEIQLALSAAGQQTQMLLESVANTQKTLSFIITKTKLDQIP